MVAQAYGPGLDAAFGSAIASREVTRRITFRLPRIASEIALEGRRCLFQSESAHTQPC
jgi:hypothetical protein